MNAAVPAVMEYAPGVEADYADEEGLEFDEEGDEWDEWDDEADEIDEFAFWRGLRSLAARTLSRVRRSPTLSGLAKGAISGGLKGAGTSLGGWLAPNSPWGGQVGGILGGALGDIGNVFLFPTQEPGKRFDEFDAALESDDDAESIVSQMEELAFLAEHADDEDEADAFISALIPLATRLLPGAASLASKVAPTLIRGATQVARVMRSSPATRKLVRTVPTMVRRATATIARQAARGRPVTRRVAHKAMRQQARQVAASPKRVALSLGRSQVLLHRLAARNRALQMKILQARRALA